MRDRYAALLKASLFALLLLLLPTCGGGSETPPGGADDGGTDDGGVDDGTPPDDPLAPILIELQPVATGLTSPIQVTNASDGSGRLFVVLQTGQIRVISSAGALLTTPFLDVAGLMITLDTIFDERGLLGLAFHPQFATNGRFYVRYSRSRTGVVGEPCFGTSRGCHESVLAEFLVQGDPTTNNVADASSERVLLTLDQPQFNHDGGHLAFGPDGHLYFSLGDGGGSNDGLGDMPPIHGPTGNGQNINTLLGSICRIDVDAAPAPGLSYAIPFDNPFASSLGADEIYAYGLRNPYRFSFDDGPGGTNQLFCADVGQRLFEELNIITRGGNYGWAHREADRCFDPLNPTQVPATCASVGPLGEALIDPVLVYDHSVGVSITGGHVYRGTAIPELSGHYVFGDWSSSFGPADGSLFFCHIAGSRAFERTKLQIEPGDNALGLTVNGFGQDEDGEIYVCGGTVSAPGGAGNVLKIVPVTP